MKSNELYQILVYNQFQDMLYFTLYKLVLLYIYSNLLYSTDCIQDLYSCIKMIVWFSLLFNATDFTGYKEHSESVK